MTSFQSQAALSQDSRNLEKLTSVILQLACSVLFQAGFTGFSTGLVNNRVVYLPIPHLVSTSPRSLNPFGQTWERVLTMTGQPNTAVRSVDDDDQDDDAVGENAMLEFPPLPEPTMH